MAMRRGKNKQGWLANNWPLLRNFLILFLLMLALLLSVTMMALHRSETQQRTALVEANRNALLRISDNVDMVITEGERIAFFLSADESIQKLAAADSFVINTYTKSDNLTQAIKSLNLLSSTTEYLRSIYVGYHSNDYLLVSDNGALPRGTISDTDWMDSADFFPAGSQKHTELRRTASAQGEKPFFLSIAQGFRTKSGFSGVVLVNLDILSLGATLNTTDAEAKPLLFLTDEKDRIIYADDLNLIGTDIAAIFPVNYSERLAPQGITSEIDGRTMLVCGVQSQKSRYHSYSATPMESIVSQSRVLRSFFVTILGIGIMLLLLLSYVLANRFYRPICSIKEILDSSTDQFSARKKKLSFQENQICDQIMFYVSANRRLENELMRRMMTLRQAQEAALQSRFNAHFLFNTLDSIYWSCVQQTGGENHASEMIMLMSDLLKSSLDQPDQLIPLREEIQLAQKFLRINEIRKPGKCVVEWDVDPNLNEVLVARMMLQPILENALIHGFKAMRTGCVIRIEASTEGKNLLICVRDNGQGFSQDALRELQQKLDKEVVLPDTQIGLCNVHMRIRLSFGQSYGVSVSSTEGKGTCVRLSLPIIATEQYSDWAAKRGLSEGGKTS